MTILKFKYSYLAEELFESVTTDDVGIGLQA